MDTEMSPYGKVQTMPFGKWDSPITDDMITSKSIGFTEIHAAKDGIFYVIEARPADAGRCCIVQWINGQARDVLPSGYNAQTAVHGYGGGAMCPLANNKTLVFSDVNTNGVWILDSATCGVTAAIVPNPQVYFADLHAHPSEERWILAICEDHRCPSGEVVNTIVAIDIIQGKTTTLVEGADFYAHPRFDPSGTRICWTQWHHPNMPWTGTELFVASWNHDGTIEKPRLLAGREGHESIAQPRWGPDGTLYFVSDQSGYWQLWRWHPACADSDPTPISLDGLETGEFASPEWWLGSSTYGLLDSKRMVAAWTFNATERLVIIDLTTLRYEFLNASVATLTGITGSALVVTSSNSIAIVASSSDSPYALYHVEFNKPASLTTLRPSATISVSSTFFSQGRPISFPRSNLNAHAFFFPPQNPHYVGPQNCLPPLVISIHGGPTLHSNPGLSLQWQYHTTRGYAVVLLNGAGSSGYGRKYREILDGKWGVLDIQDAADCARYLSTSGIVDGNAIGITGGSSGGYAALQAICDFPSLWAGAVSISGISDVEALVKDTHKFESHYPLRLIFGEHVPDDESVRRRVYRERSPRFKAHKITASTLLLQGREDQIVPLNQAEAMESSILSNGGTAKLIVFDGEGHGFPRGAENALRAVQERNEWWRRSLVSQQASVHRKLGVLLIALILMVMCLFYRVLT
ncbi:alpha/beta-hydrolase [Penicillium malachiteum]|uniref:alpha/beta-hydrolase n=1 Tax=Penicillium malachiteum TaxID=1324776 RepID=UPI0025487389|nr:alpha/beta-hydrolase [Penicillium malachiteum]KAJ5713391.1 alpha/beta-hydrolase [Penicillium malachiteum]